MEINISQSVGIKKFILQKKSCTQPKIAYSLFIFYYFKL